MAKFVNDENRRAQLAEAQARWRKSQKEQIRYLTAELKKLRLDGRQITSSPQQEIPLGPGSDPICTFCGTPSKEVQKLIFSPEGAPLKAAICSNCILECTRAWPEITSSPDLAAKLDPLFDSIFEMTLRGPATYCPPTDALIKLERTLVSAGIMPGSRRTDDAIAYARELKAKHEQQIHAAFEDSHHAHQEKLAGRERLIVIVEELAPLREGLNRTDMPEAQAKLAKLFREAYEIIKAAQGQAPITQRKLAAWNKHLREAWEDYCVRQLRVTHSMADYYVRLSRKGATQ